MPLTSFNHIDPKYAPGCRYDYNAIRVVFHDEADETDECRFQERMMRV